MPVDVEFHYDFASPNAYFCHRLIPAVEERSGARFRYFPALLGGVFKATGNRAPMEQFAGVKNKPEYQRLETARFVRRHGLDRFVFNPHFPVNSLALMRGAVHAGGRGFHADYVETVFRCMWERGLDMADEAVFERALREAGLPAGEILAGARSPEVKRALIGNTARSVELGAFGSPTFFVDGEMFFGKDRLPEVEEEILARAGRGP